MVSDKEFWLSFQTTFVVAAAEVLSIPLADLDRTYRSQTGTSLQGEPVIHDRVPGDAGYVELILQRSLKSSLSLWRGPRTAIIPFVILMAVSTPA